MTGVTSMMSSYTESYELMNSKVDQLRDYTRNHLISKGIHKKTY